MKFIPLGIQCSVPEAIKNANRREYSYPFDWMWTPSETTYSILNILINNGIEKALEYMITGYSNFKYIPKGRYISVESVTEYLMNKGTGLGNPHFKFNEEYINKLRIRLERLLIDIKSKESILFIYTDAGNPEINYYLDDIEYGKDATDFLLKIYFLIYPINKNIKIVYFCWNERKKDNSIIEYIPFDYMDDWHKISELIKKYLEILS